MWSVDMTWAQLRTILDEEELKERSAGKSFPLDITPVAFLEQALYAESRQ